MVPGLGFADRRHQPSTLSVPTPLSKHTEVWFLRATGGTAEALVPRSRH